MSKPKVWTLPALLDRIWAAVPISRKTIVHDSGGVPHRVITAFDEEYKDRTYHLNKIGAPVAAALYERIKTMRQKSSYMKPMDTEKLRELYEAVPIEKRNAYRSQLGLPPEGSPAQEDFAREAMFEMQKQHFWSGDGRL
jgi:hypothetical protein